MDGILKIADTWSEQTKASMRSPDSYRERWAYKMLLLILSIIFWSCNSNSGKIIIVTGTPSPDPLSPSNDQKIGILNSSKKTGAFNVLTKDFYSASSPALSPDAKSMTFSGRKNEKDPWQIWEMKLSNKKVRQITRCKENCLFPAYLPGGSLVFSQVLQNDSLKSSLALFRCKLDGSNCERITFSPAAWYAATILSDGRVLAKSIRLYPVSGEPQFIVLRPDGTKAELFCNNKVSFDGSRALETPDGNIIFIERNGSRSGLVSIRYNNPASKTLISTDGITGDFIAVSAANGNKLLTCYRSSSSEKYRLMEADAENLPGNLLHENKDYDVIEALLIKPGKNPRKLPSEVDNLVKTGLLLCQDINVTGSEPSAQATAPMVEILGVNASYGIIKPEPDGSFNLKVISDTPFRIVTRDEKGNVLKRCNWLYLRPNERRGCTGCHEGPGIVPENRIPLAVKKDPVLIPVHITRIDEKTVELE